MKGECKRISNDKINELNIDYIKLKSNVRRRISKNQIEFFVEGSNEEQAFNDFMNYNYSIKKVADKSNKELIEQLRVIYFQ